MKLWKRNFALPIPQILDSGKIELSEEWQWLNGDKSKGTSIIIEM